MYNHISRNSFKYRFSEGGKGITPGPTLMNKERQLEAHRS